MKAAVIRDFALGPRYESFEVEAISPETKPNAGVKVDVLAAALSPRVRSSASGEHYTSRGVLPLIPGLDGVGRLADGRRVYFIGVSDTRGTMAEQTWAHPDLLVPLPDAVSATAVAALMLPAISSWVALTKRVPLQKGQSVLVLGATGTAGQFAVQVAKELGASRVVAVGRDVAALERVRARGADDVVRLTGAKEDARAIAEVASEVDVVVDYLWGTITSNLLPVLCRKRVAEDRALHWILVGSAAGDEIALSSVLLRKRNLHVLGSGQGALSTSDMFGTAPDILRAFAAGKLHVNAREVPLSDVEKTWGHDPPSGERIVFVP